MLAPKTWSWSFYSITHFNMAVQSDAEGEITVPTTDLTPPHAAIDFGAMVAEKKIEGLTKMEIHLYTKTIMSHTQQTSKKAANLQLSVYLPNLVLYIPILATSYI